MATIKEKAETYEPKITKNITELEKVSVDVDVLSKTSNLGTEDEFTYNYIVVEEEEYRIPDSVLKQLKGIMEKKPDTKFFSVSKTGEGLRTTYQVIPE